MCQGSYLTTIDFPVKAPIYSSSYVIPFFKNLQMIPHRSYLLDVYLLLTGSCRFFALLRSGAHSTFPAYCMLRLSACCRCALWLNRPDSSVIYQSAHIFTSN